MIAELDAIKETGQRVVFIVDDNLVGNKQAIKAVLKELIAWQQRNGYPLSFFTEASIDLADDQELMALMAQADFIAVFVGIESPSEASLREARMFQNVRKGRSLLEKVHRTQESGLEVWCGMIMGFDSDDAGIFDRQVEFIQQAGIPFAMTGLLHAIPKTPLHERMLEEDQFDLSAPTDFVTNIRRLQMSPEELRNGFLRVLNDPFDVEHYFARTAGLFLHPDFKIGYVKARTE
ncbi:MAG: B12-binding domain-containing radical SAM protein [Isosphaeraceae bacterium]